MNGVGTAEASQLGDWRTPFAQVERAVAYRFRFLPFFKTSVLGLRAGGRTYRFGFNPWARPLKHLRFRAFADGDDPARWRYEACV